MPFCFFIAIILSLLWFHKVLLQEFCKQQIQWVPTYDRRLPCPHLLVSTHFKTSHNSPPIVGCCIIFPSRSRTSILFYHLWWDSFQNITRLTSCVQLHWLCIQSEALGFRHPKGLFSNLLLGPWTQLISRVMLCWKNLVGIPAEPRVDAPITLHLRDSLLSLKKHKAV